MSFSNVVIIFQYFLIDFSYFNFLMESQREGSPAPCIKIQNSLAFKKELIAMYESGIRVTDLSRIYNKPHSTVSHILGRKETIKKQEVLSDSDIFVPPKDLPSTLSVIERFLLVWISQKQLTVDDLTEAIICEKAKLLHASLASKKPQSRYRFTATKTWFERFKRTCFILGVVKSDGAGSCRAESFKERRKSSKKVIMKF